MEIKIGTAGTASRTVTEKDTALAVKSGSLQVLATPVLAKLVLKITDMRENQKGTLSKNIFHTIAQQGTFKRMPSNLNRQ